jgi:phosphocarrier protein HPr
MRQTAVIGTSGGLHARPASVFVKAVTDSGHLVYITRDGGAPLDASSILTVMSLGLKHGESVTLSTDSTAPADLLARMVALIESDLDL